MNAKQYREQRDRATAALRKIMDLGNGEPPNFDLAKLYVEQVQKITYEWERGEIDRRGLCTCPAVGTGDCEIHAEIPDA